jgi:hypothetical protein
MVAGGCRLPQGGASFGPSNEVAKRSSIPAAASAPPRSAWGDWQDLGGMLADDTGDGVQLQPLARIDDPANSMIFWDGPRGVLRIGPSDEEALGLTFGHLKIHRATRLTVPAACRRPRPRDTRFAASSEDPSSEPRHARQADARRVGMHVAPANQRRPEIACGDGAVVPEHQSAGAALAGRAHHRHELVRRG